MFGTYREKYNHAYNWTPERLQSRQRAADRRQRRGHRLCRSADSRERAIPLMDWCNAESTEFLRVA